MILFLDTTDLNKILLVLIDEGGKKRPVKKTVKIPYHESHTTLEHVDKFLKASKTMPSSIIFCSGPGSFTGIRVGASIAEALGFALNIPVGAIAKDKLPNNLNDLIKIKAGKKIIIDYGRPAI